MLEICTFSLLVLNRIMNLLHMDSHINLQSLRWPFYTRYSVPTVLGTPTSLTVQNTALSSLRGNITQWIEEAEVIRSHQIDIRYNKNPSINFSGGFIGLGCNFYDFLLNRRQTISSSIKGNTLLSLQTFNIYRSNKQKLQSVPQYGAFNKSWARIRVLSANK